MSVTVELSAQEWVWASRVGRAREDIAQANGWKHAHGFAGEDPYGPHIQGAAAELALAKVLGERWDPEFRKPDTDVGDVGELQVRSTTRQSGCLIVHKSDHDEHTFVLVTVDRERRSCTVVGWITGKEAKAESFWRSDTGRPAFFVPIPKLHPFTQEAAQRRRARRAQERHDAPCPYDNHRDTDWRLPPGNPYTRAQTWTCGVCHPPPWPVVTGSDSFTIQGTDLVERTITIERRLK